MIGRKHKKEEQPVTEDNNPEMAPVPMPEEETEVYDITTEVIPGEVAAADQPKGEIPNPEDYEQPEDFEPDDDFEDDHSKEDVGGPGGIVNNPKGEHPEGWEYVEGESTPPADETPKAVEDEG